MTKYEISIDIGDIVMLKTDTSKMKRICTGFTVRIGNVIYELTCGHETSHHYDFEIEYTENKQTIGYR